MRKIIIFIFLSIIFSSLNISLAFEYSQEDKDIFYDAFLEGYFTEMEKSINNLNIEQEKKDNFIQNLKKRTNRNELINSSWNCIQKFPIEKIVEASVICTYSWTQKQIESNKDLFDMLK